ncbi:MAG: 3-mercaptopyruvate sulfurtransferase [Asticcacaulis sp.]|uniref:3-mercaptopyruvate sulfurtransferase n=1 Tax=Asticcacaulis sp. TaxID=1872648 RepID=UPI0039E30118
MSAQIEPGCLKALSDRQAVRIIDGSWALDGTDMKALYGQSHIPGAVFFDLEAISDRSSPLPHMAPSPAQFADAVGQMGVSATDHVVIYDRQGLFSAARVWWTFKLMGHDKVQVLRGGLPAWQAEGLPVTDTVETPSHVTYPPHPTPEMAMGLEELRTVLKKGESVVLDARPAGRFAGTVPEPRAGLRSGHMPGGRSLPFGELISGGTLKPRAELEDILRDHGVVDGADIVTTCGSGVTAAIISLALYETGHKDTRLYDGSWAEWGQASLDTEVETA